MGARASSAAAWTTVTLWTPADPGARPAVPPDIPSPAKWRGPIVTTSAKREVNDSTAWSKAPLDHDLTERDLTTLSVYTQIFLRLP